MSKSIVWEMLMVGGLLLAGCSPQAQTTMEEAGQSAAEAASSAQDAAGEFASSATETVQDAAAGAVESVQAGLADAASKAAAALKGVEGGPELLGKVTDFSALPARQCRASPMSSRPRQRCPR